MFHGRNYILVDHKKGNHDNCTIFEGFNVTSESLTVAENDKTNTAHTYVGLAVHHCYYTPVGYSKYIIRHFLNIY